MMVHGLATGGTIVHRFQEAFEEFAAAACGAGVHHAALDRAAERTFRLLIASVTDRLVARGGRHRSFPFAAPYTPIAALLAALSRPSCVPGLRPAGPPCGTNVQL